ncbi:ribonuclease HII [Salipaludibacillus keqinensis]|uniref:Ribonuclease HII n=1 Tax=Salipaludibacillus keqinensis TaxID=2045207 RepID=A0A323TGZ1_9BACI|nr:ribonuclease HII [Salipaludibacillus keqinensis]PYZ93164.1 ribonuclease HII [Salipaludibacillus keqinensis]
MKKRTIKEINELMASISKEEDPLFQEILEDERKGVHQIIERWHKSQQKQQLLEKQFNDMSVYEQEARSFGYQKIAGIDEVGRGPLAGPVVAACVVLPEDFKLLGLTDSKKLSKGQRDLFYDEIMYRALAVGIGEATAKEIDHLNIYQASKKAMMRAIDDLHGISPDHLLVDAMELPVDVSQLSLIKGDAKSISIAASSVIAKVTRDRYMEKLHSKYPEYHFDKHMGYGTKVHLEAMKEFGILEDHRKSFAPVKAYL